MSVAGVDDAVNESAGRKRQPEANTEADIFDAAIIAAAKTHALAQFPRESFGLVAADNAESAQRGPGLQGLCPCRPPTAGGRRVAPGRLHRVSQRGVRARARVR